MEEVLSLLDKLRHNAIHVRQKAELFDALRQRLNQVDISLCTEKQIQTLFSDLFCSIKLEKSAYIKAKVASKSVHAIRLNQYGQILFRTIIRALSTIRLKTVKLFIYHLLDTLPVAEEILLTPVTSLYLRTLQNVLDNKSHFAHFDHDLSVDLLKFYTNALECYFGTNLGITRANRSQMERINPPAYKAEIVALMSVLASTLRSTALKLGSSCGTVESISWLQRLSNLLHAYLEIYWEFTSAHIHVLGILRQLQAYAVCNDRGCAMAQTELAVSVAAKHWNARGLTVRNEILQCLLLSKPFFQAYSHESGSCGLEELLKVTVSSLIDRYRNSPLRSIDVDPASVPSNMHSSSQFNMCSLQLRDRYDHASEKYQVLQTLSIIAAVSRIVSISERAPDEVQVTVSQPKRRKLGHPVGQNLQILDLLQTADDRHNLIALQALAVSMSSDEYPLQQEEAISAQELFKSECPEVLAWCCILFGLAINSAQDKPECLRDRLMLSHLWDCAQRNMALSVIEDSACYLANALLRNDSIRSSTIDNALLDIVRTPNLAPQTITSSSCCLMHSVLRFLQEHNIATNEYIIDSVLVWINTRMLSRHNVNTWHEVLLLDALINSFEGVSLSTSGLPPDYYSGSGLIEEATRMSGACDLLLDRHHYSNIRVRLNRFQVEPNCISILNEHSRDQVVSLLHRKSRKLSLLLADTLESETTSLLSCITLIFSFVWAVCQTRTVADHAIMSFGELARSLCKQLPDIQHTPLFFNDLADCLRYMVPRLFRIHLASTEEMSAVKNMIESILVSIRTFAMHALVIPDKHQKFEAGEELDADMLSARQETSEMTTCRYTDHTTMTNVAAVALLPSLLLDHLTPPSDTKTSFLYTFLTVNPALALHGTDLWRVWNCLAMGSASCAVLEFLIEFVLQEYEYERDDVTLQYVTDFLSITVHEWTSERETQFREKACKVFEWLLRIALTARLSSSSLRIQVYQLCQEVLKSHTDKSRHPTEHKPISMRSTLIHGLDDDDQRVAMSAAHACMSIFQIHESHTYDQIYDDMTGILSAGIYCRQRPKFKLFVLGLVAVKVEVLRVMALFHIIEMATDTENSSCVRGAVRAVSQTLETDTRVLLSKYHRTLLWHWVSERAIRSFPIHAFDFTHFADFAKLYGNEIVAQLTTTGNLDQLVEVCSLLGVEERIVLETAVPRIDSYSRIRQYDGQSFDGRRFVRETIGAESYERIVSSQDTFCEDFALLYDAVEAEHFLKKQGFGGPARTIAELSVYIDTTSRRPGREPLSMSSKMFITSLSKSAITPSRVVRCLRITYNELDRDSRVEQLQALRKLCLLIAIGGDICLSGYALISLLHGLGTVLHQKTFKHKGSVYAIMLYILAQIYRSEVTQSYVYFQSVLLLLGASCLSRLTSEQSLELRNIVLAAKSHDNVELPGLTLFMQRQGAKDIHESDIMQILCTAEHFLARSEYTCNHLLLDVLLGLLAKFYYHGCLTSSRIISKILELLGPSYLPVATADVQFYNQLRGLFFLEHLSIENKFFVTTAQPPNTRKLLLREVVLSLSAFNSYKVEQSERALAMLLSTIQEFPDEEIPTHVSSCLSAYTGSAHGGNSSSELRLAVPTLDVQIWIQKLIRYMYIRLNHDSFFSSLREALCENAELANTSLMYIIHAALLQDLSGIHSVRRTISIHFDAVFSNYSTLTARHIQTSVGVLQYLRRLPHPTQTQLRNEFLWLDIDFLSVARSSAHYSLAYQALLFLELHAVASQDKPASSQFREVQKIIYKLLPDPDSFYGIEEETPSMQTALDRAHYERAGWKGLQLQIATDSQRTDLLSNAGQYSIGTSLRDLGFDAINLGLRSASEEASESKYGSAWRLEQWNLPFTSTQPGIQQIFYRSLCKLSQVKWQSHSETNLQLRIAHESFHECCLPGTPDEQLMLACFTELNEAVNASASSESELVVLIQEVWSNRSDVLYKTIDFSFYEAIIAARQIYLNMIRLQYGISDVLVTAQLELLMNDYTRCTSSRAQQALIVATTFANKLITLPDYTAATSLDIRIKSLTAKVLWLTENHDMSVKLLHSLVKRAESDKVEPFVAACNLLELGLCTFADRSKKAADIAYDYLMPAIELISENVSPQAGTIHLKFASFCHYQFESFNENEDYRRLKALHSEKSHELDELRDMLSNCVDKNREKQLMNQRNKALALFQTDDAEFKKVNMFRDIYLARSIESFLFGLAYHDGEDKQMSRCSSIWLGNSTSSVGNSAFSKAMHLVPSHKFLILLNQFLARINTSNDHFQKVLTLLLLRLALDHPFHVLYTMYSVQHSKRSGDGPAKDRARAAAKLLQTLTSRDAKIGKLIMDVKQLCSNYVKLATTNVIKKDFATKQIPMSCISNYREFMNDLPKLQLPPLSLTLVPRLSCDYSDVPTIAGYEKSFTLAGGISVPKILQCKVSNGTVLRELVKGGNDDLRQDVVMQQVFLQVDALFRSGRETSRRNLRIRTYKVLPLTTNAGVLEWVSNTTPLHEILQALHVKYNADDWPYTTCRKAVSEVAKKSRQTRIDTYMTVMKHCNPAMKHFFYDLFIDAREWYDARLAYTRSTASISIVGYVLGLGDRHLQNIILDKKTGEVVHIDLGIAFEQGKTLPIPERVPFRLTRDVVDGMGVLGVEGVFRRCCTFTLEMMRSEQDSIKSILDVLKHDPLYSWTLSPVRRHREQERLSDMEVTSDSRTTGPEVGVEAARALLVVEQKLSASLSASAVITGLIQEATDPENLALLFAGWSAWY